MDLKDTSREYFKGHCNFKANLTIPIILMMNTFASVDKIPHFKMFETLLNYFENVETRDKIASININRTKCTAKKLEKDNNSVLKSNINNTMHFNANDIQNQKEGSTDSVDGKKLHTENDIYNDDNALDALLNSDSDLEI